MPSADARPLDGARTGDATRSCATCGKQLSSRNVIGLCKRCCGVYVGQKTRKHPKRYCGVCSKPVRGQSGLCRTHFITERLSTPEMAERRREGMLRYIAANPEKMAAHGRRNLKKLWTDPAFRERTRERAKTIQPLGQKASQDREVRARAGRSLTETVLGWCPLAYRAEYKRLMKRDGAASARSTILKRIAADRAKAKPLTFEQQLERVRSGRVGIVDKLVLPAREHEFTLGGVSDWGAM